MIVGIAIEIIMRGDDCALGEKAMQLHPPIRPI
jgi:hypothetical protein